MAESIKQKREKSFESTALFIDSRIERLKSASKDLKSKADGDFLMELSTKAERQLELAKKIKQPKIEKDRGMDFERFEP